MSTTIPTKEARRLAGLAIPGRLLFGDKHAALRREIAAAGAMWDGPKVEWLFPNRETLDRFAPRIPGLVPTAAPLPQARPEAQVQNGARFGAGSPPGLPKAAPLPAAAPPPRAAEPEPEPAPEPEPERQALVRRKPADISKPLPQTQEEKAAGTRRLTFPPGLIIIAGAVEVRGAVQHRRDGEEQRTRGGSGAPKVQEVTRTTTRIVTDPEEREKAEELARNIRQSIRAYGQHSILGAICPAELEPKLDKALLQARADAAQFNASAKYHTIVVNLVKATIAGDSEAAARMIAFDIQAVLAEMQKAINECDATKIRNVASRAKQMLNGLKLVVPESDQRLLSAAVDAARKNASAIVKGLGEKRMEIEAIKAELDSSPIQAARMSFLKYDIPAELADSNAFADVSRFENLSTEPDQPAAGEAVQAAADRFSRLG